MKGSVAESEILNRTSLREIIGGQWAVSWQGNLVLYPISVMFILFTEPAFAPSQRWIEGIAVSTLAYLPTVAILGLASITILRGRRQSPVPIALVAVVGGIGWMSRSAVLNWYLEWQDLPSDATLWQRLIFGFVLGAVLVTVTAGTLASVSVFNAQRRHLVDELVRQELTTQRLSTYVEAIRQGIIDRVQVRVDQAARAVPLRNDAGDEHPVEGVKALDSISQEAARALSRSLWRTAQQSARVDFFLLVRTCAVTRPFNYWVLIPIASLSALVMIRAWPPEAVAVVAGITIAYALVISVVANRLAPRLSPAAAVTSFIVAIALLLASGLLVDLVMRPWAAGVSSAETLPLLVALSFGVVYPLGGPWLGVGAAQRAALDRLRTSIRQQEITNTVLQREEDRIRREIATTLHGSWSGNLTAVSMRLQQAIDAGDKDAANDALREARRLIDLDIAGVVKRESFDVHTVLQTSAEAWAGIADISTEARIDGDVSTGMLTMIEDVVTEGINNAVRHGDASSIYIRVAVDAWETVVTVIDNGTPSTSNSRGMGTRMLDSVAPGAWTRYPRSHDGQTGTTLSVRISHAPTLK